MKRQVGVHKYSEMWLNLRQYLPNVTCGDWEKRAKLVLELHADKMDEAAAMICTCMMTQLFPEFDVPIIAEATFEPGFSKMTEMYCGLS